MTRAVGAFGAKGHLPSSSVRGRMAAPRAARPPSAVLLFLRANWKWVVIVLAAAAVVMVFAKD